MYVGRCLTFKPVAGFNQDLVIRVLGMTMYQFFESESCVATHVLAAVGALATINDTLALAYRTLALAYRTGALRACESRCEPLKDSRLGLSSWRVVIETRNRPAVVHYHVKKT